MIHVIAKERGVQIAQFAQDVSLSSACAYWCTQNQATILRIDNPQYGLAVVTVALPDQSQRNLEFVLAVG